MDMLSYTFLYPLCVYIHTYTCPKLHYTQKYVQKHEATESLFGGSIFCSTSDQLILNQKVIRSNPLLTLFLLLIQKLNPFRVIVIIETTEAELGDYLLNSMRK